VIVFLEPCHLRVRIPTTAPNETQFKIRVIVLTTNFYRDGCDIRELQRILGHTDIATTMIYAHTMPEDPRSSMRGNRMNDLF
jgi:uncharacterized membrane-anchored protein